MDTLSFHDHTVISRVSIDLGQFFNTSFKPIVQEYFFISGLRISALVIEYGTHFKYFTP